MPDNLDPNQTDTSATDDNKQTPKTEPKDEPVVSKKALEAERQLRKEAERREAELLAKYKEVDPDKYKSYAERIAAIEQEELEKAREWETLKKRVEEDKKAAVETVETTYKSKLTAAEQALYKVRVENELLAEAAEQGVFPKSQKLFAKLAAEFVSMDDAYNPVIADDIAPDIKGLVAHLKEQEDFGTFFAAAVPNGSGAPQNRQPAGTVGKVTRKSDLRTEADRAAYGRKYGFGFERKDPKIPALLELSD